MSAGYHAKVRIKGPLANISASGALDLTFASRGRGLVVANVKSAPLDARRGNAMSRIDIEVKGLFATPVAAVVLPDAEARNAELQEVILRRRAENPSIGAS